jgi:protease I
MNEKVLKLVRNFHFDKKIIAAICHGGSVLISADILKDINCTSYKAIQDDMVNAKGIWHDMPCVIDKNIVTSRKPDDLPYFCSAIFSLIT